MSKQISFFLTPQDFVILEDTLRNKTDFVIISSDSSDEKPILLPTLEVKEMGKEDLTVNFVRQQDLEKVIFDKVNENRYFIDVLFSPIIEVTRCYITKGTFRSGRMYFTTGYYDKNGLWKNKNEDFLNWAQKVFNLTKKSLIRNKEIDAYTGEEAKKLLDAGKVKVLDI
jgi:hypothetical protein